MGSTSSCLKHQNLNQNEFQIPVIVKQQLIQHHPTKQNYLIEPLYCLGEKSESLEELEAILQQSYANLSFHQTATFHSNNNLKASQKDKQPISLAQLPNQQESHKKQSIHNKDNQNQNLQQHSALQDHIQQEKNEDKLNNQQSQKRKSFSRSLSNLKQQQCEYKDDQSQKQKDDQSQKQKDPDQNTIKSILKNKSKILNQKQLYYKRGQSLNQKQNFVEVDDNQSQKTNKSQKKKVKFDPKVFRQKNTHFFQ